MKVGDLVKAAYVRMNQPGKYHSGIIVEIEKSDDIFSEKYAFAVTNTYIKVLSAGRVMTFEPGEDIIEVIDENR